jgi:hypothetical protein
MPQAATLKRESLRSSGTSILKWIKFRGIELKKKKLTANGLECIGARMESRGPVFRFVLLAIYFMRIIYGQLRPVDPTFFI